MGMEESDYAPVSEGGQGHTYAPLLEAGRTGVTAEIEVELRVKVGARETREIIRMHVPPNRDIRVFVGNVGRDLVDRAVRAVEEGM